MAMRGMHSSEQFPLFRERGCELRVLVPVEWAPPLPGAIWRARRRFPSVEQDHGVTIEHPRYLSLARFLRLPGGPAVQRILYRRALARTVTGFVASGGDVVHLHSCSLPGAIIPHLGSAKLVVSMHDHELASTVPNDRAWRAPIARTLRRADSVVYVSEALRTMGRSLIGPHADVVIPTAINDHPDIVPRPAGAFTVVTAARLVEGKNIEHLVEAFARVLASIPEARLVVIGDGPERGRLEALVAGRSVIGAVDFRGHLPNREVREQMARAHLFVLPSAPESLGNVYFEAMSLGVPVVGVRGQGISDHLTDGVDGFLVDAGDVEALGRIMLEMHGQPARRQAMGDRAYALFERSGVRWQDYVASHVALYERLVGAEA